MTPEEFKRGGPSIRAQALGMNRGAAEYEIQAKFAAQQGNTMPPAAAPAPPFITVLIDRLHGIFGRVADLNSSVASFNERLAGPRSTTTGESARSGDGPPEGSATVALHMLDGICRQISELEEEVRRLNCIG